MANLFKQFGEGGEIFKDERILLPEFQPETLPHREKEMKELAYALRGAAEGSRPEHLMIFGRPGTGKTCTARFVLGQLKEYSQKALPVYINCWEFPTRYAVMTQLASSVGEIVPRRGIAADEIFDRITASLKGDGKIVVLVLDEIDRLLGGGEQEERVLYDVLRAGENRGVPFGVIGVANDEEAMVRVDARIRSSLGRQRLVFASYTPVQLKDILRERAKRAFHDGALGEEVIPLCAAHAAKNGGDARLAIALMWKAGRAAEKEGAKRVEARHCKAMIEETERAVKEERLAKLTQMERRMLELIEKRSELLSGELYSLLQKEFGETERTMRNYIERLERMGLISAGERERGRGRRGLTRVLRIKKK